MEFAVHQCIIWKCRITSRGERERMPALTETAKDVWMGFSGQPRPLFATVKKEDNSAFRITEHFGSLTPRLC
jgi:hypothetical protein